MYSFTRPNGKKATEWGIGRTDDVSELVYDWKYDDEMDEILLDPDLETFCIGAFEPYRGDVFYAYRFGYIQEGDSDYLYEEDYYDMSFKVKDGYLNMGSFFTNKSYKSTSATNLKLGNTYYYYLYNDNEKLNYPIRIYPDTFYVKSSNTSVVTINKYGKVTPQKAGHAKLTIKPSSVSDISYSKTVVVRPKKVVNIKITAPKKRSLKLTWSKINGANGYQIYRSTSKNGTYKLVKTITSGTTVTYTNSNLSSGKTYYYKVRAYVNWNSKKYPGAYSDKKYKKTL